MQAFPDELVTTTRTIKTILSTLTVSGKQIQKDNSEKYLQNLVINLAHSTKLDHIYLV